MRDGTPRMRARGLPVLTVQQPWASAILLKGKDVENRTWRAHLKPGSLLGIHAGQTFDASARREELADLVDAPRGVLLGIVTFAGVHHVLRCGGNCSSWAASAQWHWMLADPRPLTPVPFRGQLGLWAADLPAEWVDALREVTR